MWQTLIEPQNYLKNEGKVKKTNILKLVEFESSTLGLGFRVLSPANGFEGLGFCGNNDDKGRTSRTKIFECFCTHSWIAPNFRLRSRRVWVVILFTNFDFLFALLDAAGNFFESEFCWNAVCWLVGGPRAGVFVLLSQFDR